MPRSVPNDEVVKKQQAADRGQPKRQTRPRKDAAAEASRRAAVKEANESMNERARAQSDYGTTPAAEAEHDTWANRGLGRLLARFRRSRGRKKLEETADAALGRKK